MKKKRKKARMHGRIKDFWKRGGGVGGVQMCRGGGGGGGEGGSLC